LSQLIPSEVPLKSCKSLPHDVGNDTLKGTSAPEVGVTVPPGTQLIRQEFRLPGDPERGPTDIEHQRSGTNLLVVGLQGHTYKRPCGHKL
jgi:hypothetical protein